MATSRNLDLFWQIQPQSPNIVSIPAVTFTFRYENSGSLLESPGFRGEVQVFAQGALRSVPGF